LDLLQQMQKAVFFFAACFRDAENLLAGAAQRVQRALEHLLDEALIERRR